MRVAVITANLGGHDYVGHPIADQTVDAEWVYVSDQALDVTALPLPWNFCRAGEFMRHTDPRLEAKRYRMPPFGDAIINLASFDWVVWIDASTEITSPTFLHEAIACTVEAHDLSRPADDDLLWRSAPLATWRHPFRDCVYEEAKVSLDEQPAKYDPHRDPIARQLVRYIEEDYPEHAGLYATGTLVWNMKLGGGEGTPRHADVLGAEWLSEILHTSVQDQLSLPVVSRHLGDVGRVNTFPFSQIEYAPDVLGNRWLRYHEHTRPS